MTAPINTSPEAKTISRRLYRLVFRSLASVLLCLLVFLILGEWGILGWLNSSPESLEPLLVYMLETHYQERGSWEGVAAVFERSSSSTIAIYQRHWNDAMLLDANGQVVIDQGGTSSPLIGRTYTPTADELHFPLKINNQVIGTLVFHNRRPFEPLTLFFPVTGPFAILATLMTILALFIALVLVRRLVNPLSEVIAAARSVSQGKLSARVQGGGPGDLQVLSDSFNQMAESLEQNDRERREMLAIIAHELRTPLSIMRGKLEGIVDGIYPADDAHIAGVLEETYLLERLVEDLRLLALAESRKLHFDAKPVDLSELAGRSVELFAAEAEEKKIELKLSAAADLPGITADPQRMEQAMSNLIGNALRYIPEGGQVNVATRRTESGRIEVVVSDNGPGVSEEDLPYIFDRFWRGESARSRLTGGTGLGLAIAKELVEAQGGQISARNRTEGGLEVVISFGNEKGG